VQATELQANGATGQLHVSVQPMNPAAVAAAQRARHLINNTKVIQWIIVTFWSRSCWSPSYSLAARGHRGKLFASLAYQSALLK
jgi:hypothetical protein